MNRYRHFILKDFKKAKYTAIVSDLHLCEAEPIHPRKSLWKKYKSREFFFDDEFVLFLEFLQEKSRGESIELILNGDIFDFDSVMSLPKNPAYRISWIEKKRGLHPQEEKSVFKIKKILSHHKKWVRGLQSFLHKGHRVIFIIGNHDVELHFPKVKESIVEALTDLEEIKPLIRFNEWFYISNEDTLIEHGNQHDSFCITEDPVNPFIIRFNRLEVRVPFGNLATRYMINGMGFFNPHVESIYKMRAKDYIFFFFKYVIKTQPCLLFTWLWGATVVLIQSFMDRLRAPLKDPLNIEDRIEWIAQKSNTKPKVVRELRDLFVEPATSNPLLIARELWIDRAAILFLALFAIFFIFLFINNVYDISFFWTLIPILFFLPFFIFYTESLISHVPESKEPKEKNLSMAGLIAGVKRVVYGHTHSPKHEMIGPIEYLNSGTWSPAFKDVECKFPVAKRTFIWIKPYLDKGRKAELLSFELKK